MLVEEDIAPGLAGGPMLAIYDEAARRALVAMDVEHELKLGERFVVDGENGTKSIVWDVLAVRTLA